MQEYSARNLQDIQECGQILCKISQSKKIPSSCNCKFLQVFASHIILIQILIPVLILFPSGFLFSVFFYAMRMMAGDSESTSQFSISPFFTSIIIHKWKSIEEERKGNYVFTCALGLRHYMHVYPCIHVLEFKEQFQCTLYYEM